VSRPAAVRATLLTGTYAAIGAARIVHDVRVTRRR
jgi:hypothetical protein